MVNRQGYIPPFKLLPAGIQLPVFLGRMDKVPQHIGSAQHENVPCYMRVDRFSGIEQYVTGAWVSVETGEEIQLIRGSWMLSCGPALDIVNPTWLGPQVDACL